MQHKAACKSARGAADGGQQTTKKPHQQHNAFTPEEDDAIRKGVLKYGAGKWKEILTDPTLPFLADGVRTAVDLKVRSTLRDPRLRDSERSFFAAGDRTNGDIWR